MQNLVAKIKESVAFLDAQGFADARVAVVLGTGLSDLLQYVKEIASIPYTDIPHFPQATVEFHKGRLLLGYLHGQKIIIMQGRFHYYEGYNMQEVTFGVRVLKELGIQLLLLSNAAGGIHKSHRKGDLVVIKDHINLLPDNPLRGLNDPYFGNRFVDMFSPYSKEINKGLLATAKKLRITLKKGVYVAVQGPNLETRAEYKYLRAAGADMVGMSTVPEVIVANHVGLPCAAISVITDECQPQNLKPVNISEIISVAAEADKRLSLLLTAFLKQWLA